MGEIRVLTVNIIGKYGETAIDDFPAMELMMVMTTEDIFSVFISQSLRIHVWNIYLHWDYFKLL